MKRSLPHFTGSLPPTRVVVLLICLWFNLAFLSAGYSIGPEQKIVTSKNYDPQMPFEIKVFEHPDYVEYDLTIKDIGREVRLEFIKVESGSDTVTNAGAVTLRGSEAEAGGEFFGLLLPKNLPVRYIVSFYTNNPWVRYQVLLESWKGMKVTH